MARKIFKRVGLRRDFNFSDLSDSKTALNNLLDTLVDDQTATFISEDLDAIRNVFAEGMSSEDYQNVIGSAVENTNANGINQPVFPRITYQNRLDKFEVFSGDPRFNGGNGLTATYFNEDQVDDTTSGIFVGVTTGGIIPGDTFWEDGNFNYTGKIHPQSVNANGGVLWEGFFVPTQTGSYTFNTSASLGFTMDFQTEGYVSGINTYTEYQRVGLAVTVTATTSGTNVVTIPTANVPNVGIGMSVSGSGILAGTTIGEDNSIDRTTGEITLTNDSGDPITTANSNIPVTFFRDPGTSVSTSFSTYVLEAFERYRVRFRFYVPQSVNAIGVDRNIDFNYNPPGGSSATDLRYNNLYSLNYDFSESAKGSFNNFYDQSILFGGGLIGGSANSNAYVKVKSTKKIDIKYSPKTSWDAITRAEPTASTTNNSKVASLTDTSNIEIGNYVFGTGIPENTRVTEIIINNSFIMSNAATSTTASNALSIIDHRGFVKRVNGRATTGGNIIITSGNTNDLKTNMIVIGKDPADGDELTQYTGITTDGSLLQVGILPAPSSALGAGSTFYFYESRGLVDEALNAFCVPANTRCMIVTSDTPAGSTSIPVQDTTGVGNGWKVQGFQFASGTTVNGAPLSNTIALSAATTKNLIAGANFTVTNASGDRQLCCPPTDTSPPFNPTEEGLDTTSSEQSLRIEEGNVVFDALTANVTASKITNYASSDKSNSRLELRAGDGTTYKVLCV